MIVLGLKANVRYDEAPGSQALLVSVFIVDDGSFKCFGTKLDDWLQLQKANND